MEKNKTKKTSKRKLGNLKKYFVPHKQNDYHPHIFRNTSLASIFVLCIFLLGISVGNFIFLDKTVMGANIAANVLVDMANDSRRASGTQLLVRNKKLDLAASLKAEDMVRNKYFSHFSPDGTTPWFFIREAGYNFVYAGENLAINFYESLDVQKAWMNSATHRANLLNNKFKEIGIATKEGFYNGANTIYVVQMFGTEAPPKLENVFGDYKKEQDAKKNTIEDSRLTENTSKNKDENVKIIQQGKNFLSFKDEELENQNNISESENKMVAGVETYSSRWDRFIFSISSYIQVIYFAILFIITIAFFIRIFVEYEKQHYKHIVLSLFFLLLILFLAFMNYNFVIELF